MAVPAQPSAIRSPAGEAMDLAATPSHHRRYVRLRALCLEIAERVAEPMAADAFPDLQPLLQRIAEVADGLGLPAVPLAWVGSDRPTFEQLLCDTQLSRRRRIRTSRRGGPRPSRTRRRLGGASSAGWREEPQRRPFDMLEGVRRSTWATLQLTDPVTELPEQVTVFWSPGPVGTFWQGQYVELRPPCSQLAQRRTVQTAMGRWVRYLDGLLEDAVLAADQAVAAASPAPGLPSGVEPPSPRAGTKRKAKPRRLLKDWEPLIDAYMKEHPGATTRKTGADLGCSSGTVGKSAAWDKRGNRRRGQHKKVALNTSAVNADGGKPARPQRAHEDQVASGDEALDQKQHEKLQKIEEIEAQDPSVEDSKIAQKLGDGTTAREIELLRAAREGRRKRQEAN